MSRVRLSRFINGGSVVSADLAIRLGLWPGGSAQSWMRMQADYALWQAEHSGKPDSSGLVVCPVAQSAFPFCRRKP
jgi:plasmid maintenance system antidote protein VapI